MEKNQIPADSGIYLSDGALKSLAKSNKLDVIASVVETTDNAMSAGASIIDIKTNRQTGYLNVFSYEANNHLDDEHKEEFFRLGVDHEVKFSIDGLNMYGEGVKLAAACLISTKGEMKVISNPVEGEKWGAIHYIDYTDPQNLHDQKIEYLDKTQCEIPGGGKYNFLVQFGGCDFMLQNSEKSVDMIFMYIIAILGRRYRTQLESGQVAISVEGRQVRPQDHLYSRYGDLAHYHDPVYLPWHNDPHAVMYEWSDLNDLAMLDDITYCLLDTAELNNVKKASLLTSAGSGIEVAVNGYTIIQPSSDGLLAIIGKRQQPSSNGFRGRMTILNQELANMYIIGGNKCDCSVIKSFGRIQDANNKSVYNPDTKTIVKYIENTYKTVVARHNKLKKDKQLDLQPDGLNKLCKSYNTPYRFAFVVASDNTKTFAINKRDKNIIEININSKLFKDFSQERYIAALIDGYIAKKDMTVIDIQRRLMSHEIFLSRMDEKVLV